MWKSDSTRQRCRFVFCHYEDCLYIRKDLRQPLVTCESEYLWTPPATCNIELWISCCSNFSLFTVSIRSNPTVCTRRNPLLFDNTPTSYNHDKTGPSGHRLLWKVYYKIALVFYISEKLKQYENVVLKFIINQRTPEQKLKISTFQIEVGYPMGYKLCTSLGRARTLQGVSTNVNVFCYVDIICAGLSDSNKIF